MVKSSDTKDDGAKPLLQVASFSDLLKNEKEILERIERTPNGAQLFLIHPLMLFKDIGVELSERAEQELRQHEPALAALSAIPYEALKQSKEEQHVRFELRGLFKGKETS